MEMEAKKKTIPYIDILFIVMLILYPFRHVSFGVDLMDGGYSYANFTYCGEEYMDSMWFFATWLANVVGHFLGKLPFGNLMLGMNIYTTLFVSAMAVVGYYFFTKELGLPKWIVFVSEMVAVSLCWVPTAALYNYLTYFLLLWGVILLYRGLVKEKNWCLIGAGICLGLNVGVRFSNLPQMGLVLAVWYYCIRKKVAWKETCKKTVLCILAYVGSFGLLFVIIGVLYGFGDYTEGIRRLFAMTEYATDYAADSMLKTMVKGYTAIGYWFKRCVLAGGITLVICGVFPKKCALLKKIITAAVMLGLMWWCKDSGFYSLDSRSYYSVYYPYILLFVAAMGIAVFNLCDKNVSEDKKLQAVIMLILILVTSLGSNNAILSTINNLFFILPCLGGLVHDFVVQKEHIIFWPFKAFLLIYLVFAIWQAGKYGYHYVYEEAAGAMDLSVEISKVPRLKGMYTGAEKAEELEALYEFLKESGLREKECMLFGDIPGISYYMELPPALNIWSDLRSYSPTTMERDMKEIEAQIESDGTYPIIIMHKKYEGYYQKGDESILPEEKTIKMKLDYLCGFIEKYEYRSLYESGYFEVLGR